MFANLWLHVLTVACSVTTSALPIRERADPTSYDAALNPLGDARMVSPNAGNVDLECGLTCIRSGFSAVAKLLAGRRTCSVPPLNHV